MPPRAPEISARELPPSGHPTSRRLTMGRVRARREGACAGPSARTELVVRTIPFRMEDADAQESWTPAPGGGNGRDGIVRTRAKAAGAQGFVAAGTRRVLLVARGHRRPAGFPIGTRRVDLRRRRSEAPPSRPAS